MKILLVKNSLIPPPQYGGTQRIVYWLANHLVDLGHEVYLSADRQSDIFKQGRIKYLNYQACAVPKYIDLVHFHELPKQLPADRPYIFSMHGNQTKQQVLPDNTLFLSRSQAANHQARLYVSNGIDTSEYQFQTTKNKHLLFMALLNWRVKNGSLALQLANRCKIPLDVGGGEYWRSWKIFSPQLIKNYFQHRRLVSEYGMVGGEQKIQLLSQSGLLFYLVNWPEPFGLAPHEALASGTPVLASANGALAEYIQDGYNGYLVSSLAEAEQAISSHFQKTPERIATMAKQCRQTASSSLDMAESYLKFYQQVIDTGRLYAPAEQPRFAFKQPQSVII